MTSLPSIHPQKTAYAVKKKTKKAEISEDCLPSEQNGIESRSHKNVIASKGCKSWNALERIDSAVKEYYSCPSKPSIRRIAKIHGLETNLLKLHLDCSERDDLFFDKFSLNFHVDNVIDSFQHVPLRYCLVLGVPNRAPFKYVDSGSLSKESLARKIGENCVCNVQNIWFVSLANSKTKTYLLQECFDTINPSLDNNGSFSPNHIVWNGDLLSKLCSIYVVLHKRSLPPGRYFKEIMMSKRADVFSSKFAFVLFDKYILMHFPNYFHIMCGHNKDPTEMGRLLYKYADLHNSAFTKIANAIRIKDIVSSPEKSKNVEKNG